MKIKYVCKTKKDLEIMIKKFPDFFNSLITRNMLYEIQENNDVYIYCSDVPGEEITFCSKSKQQCNLCDIEEECNEYKKVYVDRNLKLKRILND